MIKKNIPKHIQAIQEMQSSEQSLKDREINLESQVYPHWKKAKETALSTDEMEVVDILKTVIDPELNINIYEMGLIYEIKFEDKNNEEVVQIDMTFTTPFCPFANNILNQIEESIEEFTGKNVEIKIVFDPKWNTNFITDNAKLEADIY